MNVNQHAILTSHVQKDSKDTKMTKLAPVILYTNHLQLNKLTI
jgi:hypothetical protein